MTNAFEVLSVTADLGGQLGIAGDRLRVRLPPDCPPHFKDVIRQHKAALMDLLSHNFLVVHSEALKTKVFFAPDDETKSALIAAGAERANVYTVAELESLIKGGATSAQLPLIHAARTRFKGRLVKPQ